MAIDTVVTRFIQEGVSGLRGDLRAIGGDMATAEGRADRLSDRLLALGTAGAAGLGALGLASLKAHGEIQMAEIGFSKTLGSMNAAKAKIEELRQFDRTSPFSFKESVKGAQRLSAVGFKAEELMGTLRDIGDATSGSGGGTEDFMGISRAIGQMKSKGRISMEEINQLGDRGINALAILQKQLRLTDEQKQKLMEGTYTIKSDVGVDALLKGFRELYGGAMMEASKTFPGQVSNLSSAVFQLGDALGEILSADGTGLISDLTGITDATTKFVRNNPELVKTGLILAGIGSGAAIIAGAYIKLNHILKTTAAAKKTLELATKSDAAAEAAKTVVAGKEGAAIGAAGDAATAAAAAKGTLATQTGKAAAASAAELQAAAKITQIEKARIVTSKSLSRAMVALDTARGKASVASKAAQAAVGTKGEAAAAAKAADAAQKVLEAEKRIATLRNARTGLNAAQANAQTALNAARDASAAAAKTADAAATARGGRFAGALGRARDFLGRPLITGGTSATNLPGAASRYQFLGYGRYRDTLTGRFAARDVVKAWESQIATAAKNSKGLKGLLGRTSVGAAAGGALTGAFAGVGVYEDLKVLGKSQGESMAAGLGVGLGAAALAAFNPPAALLIGAAVTLREGANMLYNRPAEKIAEEGDFGSKLSEKRAKENVGRKLTLEERAQQAEEDANKLQAQADKLNRENAWTWDDQDIIDLETEAESKRIAAENYRNLARKRDVQIYNPNSAEAIAAREEQRRQLPDPHSAEGMRARDEELKAKGLYNRGLDPRWQREQRRKDEQWLREVRAKEQPQYTHQRNGETIVNVKIPNRPADIAHRNRHHAAMTPMPTY
jgi:tape measure domain-containing protein